MNQRAQQAFRFSVVESLKQHAVKVCTGAHGFGF
jgi:hypothetical protein